MLAAAIAVSAGMVWVYGADTPLPESAAVPLTLGQQGDAVVAIPGDVAGEDMADGIAAELGRLQQQIDELKVARQAAGKDGVVVYRPEGAELAEFRARGAKAQEELVKSIGPSAVPIWARIQAAVKACGG